MLKMTNSEKRQRRPACGQCGGTGYVHLWAIARAGPRTWFCDRCKRFWSDGEQSLATPVGDLVGVPAAVPVLASPEHQPLEPAANGGDAAEPSQPRPRLRVVEPKVVRVARGGDDAQSSPSSAPAPTPPYERLPL